MLLRFHHWDDVLAAPDPGGNLAVARTMWHYARSAAYADMMDFRNATMERDRFVVESASIPKDLPWGVNATGPVLALAGAELSARIAEARVDMPDAIASWRDAVALQDAIPYDEPPDWYYPIRESLDGAMLRAGHYAQAELVFREDLRRNPRNPRSLFGLL